MHLPRSRPARNCGTEITAELETLLVVAMPDNADGSIGDEVQAVERESCSLSHEEMADMVQPVALPLGRVWCVLSATRRQVS